MEPFSWFAIIKILVTFITGFFTNYAPSIGKFFADKSKAAQETADELSKMNIQLEIEKVKASSAEKLAGIDSESRQMLMNIQSSILEMQEEMKDVKDARAREVAVHNSIVNLLKSAKGLNLTQDTIDSGWRWAMRVEVLSASVTPLIAGTVFGLWALFKATLCYKIFGETGKLAELVQAWTFDDLQIMVLILGYYYGHRKMNKVQTKTALTL